LLLDKFFFCERSDQFACEGFAVWSLHYVWSLIGTAEEHWGVYAQFPKYNVENVGWVVQCWCGTALILPNSHKNTVYVFSEFNK